MIVIISKRREMLMTQIRELWEAVSAEAAEGQNLHCRGEGVAGEGDDAHNPAPLPATLRLVSAPPRFCYSRFATPIFGNITYFFLDYINIKSKSR